MARSRNKLTGKNTQPRKQGFKNTRNNKRPEQHLKQSPAPKDAVASNHTSSADHSKAQAPGVIRRPAPKGARVVETLPVILETTPSDDYALIDSGLGRKLERYGPFKIDRPEAQAIWQPRLNETEWSNVDAIFTGERDEEGLGRWQFPKKTIAGNLAVAI